jgi:2-polyprenyl-3-methyl-5-hydroxy-6-metoxy-1,4-benzoquinol methylase
MRNFITNYNYKILEIGPGSGQLLSILNFFSKVEKKNIYYLEIDHDSLNIIKKKGFKNLKSSFEQYKITNRRFDLIIMNQTLEHLKNPNKCFKKLNKILNKDGMLFIETPTSDFYLKNKINKSIWGGLHAPRHMYIYNIENMINLSKKFVWT